MYINYDRSYKKRRKKGIGKAIKMLIIIVLALGLGLAAFYAIKMQISAESIKVQSDQDSFTGECGQDSNIVQGEIIVPSVSLVVTVTAEQAAVPSLQLF